MSAPTAPATIVAPSCWAFASWRVGRDAASRYPATTAIRSPNPMMPCTIPHTYTIRARFSAAFR